LLPYHLQVVRRYAKEGRWGFLSVKPFHNPRGLSSELEENYGLTKARVTIELFRINGGREGWYLVNLRDRKYYYCGLDREDVRVKLLEISGD
jgi:hypothetical protein